MTSFYESRSFFPSAHLRTSLFFSNSVLGAKNSSELREIRKVWKEEFNLDLERIGRASMSDAEEEIVTNGRLLILLKFSRTDFLN